MDKKNGLLNIGVSLIFKLALLIGAILVRRFLIKYNGVDINGLNSLYASIIGFLSVVELGCGAAIAYCMYKPIVEADNDKVSALYRLFTKLYLIIGGIILVSGCAVMPLLPFLADGYKSVNQNLYLTFSLSVVAVVLTYLFSAKISLINAYKNNYITTIITSSSMLLQYGLQIVALVLTKSFIWYLICAIVAAGVQWLITEIVTYKKYGYIIKNKQRIDAETKKEVTKNVKAMFMHKIGGVLVNTADNVLISAFIGIVLLGKFANYTTLVLAMVGILTMLFTPLTSIIGHLCVGEDKITVKKYLDFFHMFNFVVGLVCFLWYFAVIDNLINFFYKSSDDLGLTLPKSVSFIITLNYFIQFMRNTVLLFRDATGTFYYDRWKPIFEGVLNVGLSIGFVYLFRYLFGADFAVVGVIAATIITNLTICHIVEPHVLFKYGLQASPKSYYLRNYLYILLFAAALVALHFCLCSYENEWKELLINGFISLAISVPSAIAVVMLNGDSRHYMKSFIKKLKTNFKKAKKREELFPKTR